MGAADEDFNAIRGVLLIRCEIEVVTFWSQE